VVAALILVLTFVVQVDLFKYSIRYSLQGVALFILFPSVVYVRKFIFINKFISLGFWRWLGKISYSLYLWHVAVITVMGHMFCEELASCDISDQRPLLFYSLSLILALMISIASYHLVEEKFIKLRKRYR
jgi:peptidoglycan/LPS O-acetylase OafA/YrhL